MSTKLRFYIGQVLDIYKQAAGSRYGSVNDATSSKLSVSYLALRVYLPLQVQLVSFTTSHIISHGVYFIQEVCKKKILYTGSNFRVKASGPLPPLLYVVVNSHALGGKFPHLAVHFQIFKFYFIFP